MIVELPGSVALSTAAAATLDQLVRASIAGALFVAAVWGLIRLAPRLPASVRCALWWAVSLKLLVALVWVAPVELPLLPAVPASAPAPAAVGAPAAAAEPEAPLPGLSSAAAAVRAVPAPPSRAEAPAAGPARSLPWRQALVALWLLGLAAGAAGVGRELGAVRRLRRESRPAADPDLLARFAALRERLGVRPRVELRLAEAIGTPLTIGLVRPAVVLPARTRQELSGEELTLALAHELLHVRRRDLWTGWVPAVARRLFFFHPLAALAAREYHLAREAACDAAVVRELGAAPRAYGRLLLRWSTSPAGRGARAASLSRVSPGALPGIGAAAGAPTSSLDLKRRLVMLQNPSSVSRGLTTLAWSAALLAAAALVPLRIVAQPPEPPEPPAAPAPPDAPAPPAPPAAPAVHPTPAAPEPPAPPAAPRAPAVPKAPRPPASSGNVWSWTDDRGGGGGAWALLEGDSHWVHAGSADHHRLTRLRSASGEPLLWFRRDGAEYVVRDAATIERAKEILRPQQELGRRQGELGRQQGELGRRQGELGGRQRELGGRQRELGARQSELGAQQARLGAQQAKLGAEQAELAAEHAALAARRAADGGRGEQAEHRARRDELESRMAELSARMRELGERQRELGERQRELAAPQAELGERQHELGVPQAELGKRQAELGARQAELGRQQAAAAREAEPLLRALFDQAIARGLAERVD